MHITGGRHARRPPLTSPNIPKVNKCPRSIRTKCEIPRLLFKSVNEKMVSDMGARCCSPASVGGVGAAIRRYPMETQIECQTCTIRSINDELRTTGKGGQIFITTGIRFRGEAFIMAVNKALKTFNDFTPENDPYGDHDFGRMEVEGVPILWKIDYYDTELKYGSDNPADPSVSSRVLTMMLANEY